MFSLQQDPIANIGCITKALTGLSYLRIGTQSHMTRQLEGTKVDFVQPIKAPWKT